MTVSSTNNKASYSANGSTTTFAYNFKITAESELKVFIRSAAGTETLKTLTTHYTITNVGVAGGGNVVFVTSPSDHTPANGETVVIQRVVPLTQATDYVENDPFPAATHEAALDKLTFVAQQLQEEIDRTIKLSVTNTMTSTEFTTSATDRASKVLAFDSSGELSVTTELGTYKGNWAASTDYVIRDLVKDTSTGNIFFVNTAHTSSGSQPLTSNANSAKYSLLVDAASATTSANAAATSAQLADDYAVKVSGAVTGTDYSSKAWAVGGTGVTTTSSRGAAKEWATTTGGQVDTSEYSSKEYAIGTTATSSKSYALKTDGAVTGSDYSSKAWATGGTGVTTSSGGGAAKEWATTTGGAVDTSEFSAKEYSTGTTVGTGSSKQWALGGGSFVQGTAVAGGEYSAKYHAAAASTSAGTATTKAGEAASSATAAASSATAAASSATAAASSQSAAAASAAAAATTYDSFDDRYLGTKSSDPSQDNDGNALVTGALYFSTSSNTMMVYDGSSWIAATSAGTTSLLIFKYVATNGQTTFTGSDANSATLTYTVNNIIVTVNGVVLDSTDMTATNGTSIVLTACSTGDEVVIYSFKSFEVSGALSLSNGGTVAGNTTFTGSLTGTLTGTATNATHVNVADNESTDENNLIPFIEDASATGNVGLESDGDFHYNPSTGRITATQLAGTLQTAAQPNITSVGTLTSATVSGDVNVDSKLFNIDSSNDRIGINTNSIAENASAKLTINVDNSGGLIINNTGQTNGEFASMFFASHATSSANAKQGIGVKRTGDFGVGDLVFAVDSNADNASVSMVNDAKMTISQAGIVTMPLQPAFMATSNSNNNHVFSSADSYEQIITNVTTIDKNSDYASSTFTAPVDGTYFISGAVMHNASSSGVVDYDLAVYVNSSIALYARDGNDNYTITKMHAVNGLVDLDDGDTVKLYARVGDVKSRMYFSTTTLKFQGYLIA